MVFTAFSGFRNGGLRIQVRLPQRQPTIGTREKPTLAENLAANTRPRELE